MEDLSRAVDEDLLKDLECPVCMEYMVPPITLCTNGHSICSKCRESVQRCPTCRAEFSVIRNVVLENIVRRRKYPCANRQSGCLELFSIEHIAKHHGVCEYGKIKCPLHLFNACFWNGLKNDLKGHIRAEHPTFFFEGPTLPDPHLSSSLGVVSYLGELFTYYKEKRDGRYYAAVQLIGTNSEASKYKCEFKLNATNGIEQISKTLLVRGYSEDFETIFNSGLCLYLNEKTIKHFCGENKLKMTVELSRV